MFENIIYIDNFEYSKKSIICLFFLFDGVDALIINSYDNF